MSKYTLPFNLEHARAGEPIQTIEGHERRLIAYLPDRRHHLRVVVLDPKADKLYSHSESGEHCELVASLKLVMKPVKEPIQEPAATKSVAQETNLLSRELRTEIIKLVRAAICAEESKPEPAAKVVRWLAVWESNTAGGAYYCSPVLFTNEFDAVTRAKIAVQGTNGAYINPRAIRVEL